MTPLDKMSAALALSQSGEDCFGALEPEQQEALRENVRAVLGAIREPSEAMCTAAWRTDPLSCDVKPDRVRQVYAPEWQAMLDAALTES